MGICVARQPIFTASLKTFGYELLFRDSAASSDIGDVSADTASSEIIINSFHEMDISRVTNGKRAFVNFTEKLLADKVATLLPCSILVVEISETIEPSAELLEECARLRREGYLFAFDEFVLAPEYSDFLGVADIVRIDFADTPIAKIKKLAKQVTGRNIMLLAKKLESNDLFEIARDLGFKLFQGRFFCKPVVVKADSKLSVKKMNCLQLFRLSLEEDADFTEMSNVIKTDVALSYMLFRVVNSAFFGLYYTVKNIKQALAILGLEGIRKWLALVSMARINDQKPSELVTMSLTRARFLELIAPDAGITSDVDDLFVLGLMSLMDALMDMSPEDIVKNTGISKSIAKPLLTREGKSGRLLSMIIHYENSEWREVQEIAGEYGLTMDNISEKYTSAIEWAEKIP